MNQQQVSLKDLATQRERIQSQVASLSKEESRLEGVISEKNRERDESAARLNELGVDTNNLDGERTRILNEISEIQNGVEAKAGTAASQLTGINNALEGVKPDEEAS